MKKLTLLFLALCLTGCSTKKVDDSNQPQASQPTINSSEEFYSLLASYKPFDYTSNFGMLDYYNQYEEESGYDVKRVNLIYNYMNEDGTGGRYGTFYVQNEDGQNETKFTLLIPCELETDYHQALFMDKMYSAGKYSERIIDNDQYYDIVAAQENKEYINTGGVATYTILV